MATPMKPLLFAASVATLVLASASMAADNAPSPGVKRTVLSRTDVPNSNYETVLVLVEIPANTRVGRHKHPGSVMGYVFEGESNIEIEGRPAQNLPLRSTLEVPLGAVHDEFTTSKPAKIVAVFTVEKGKPLTTPVAP